MDIIALRRANLYVNAVISDAVQVFIKLFNALVTCWEVCGCLPISRCMANLMSPLMISLD